MLYNMRGRQIAHVDGDDGKWALEKLAGPINDVGCWIASAIVKAGIYDVAYNTIEQGMSLRRSGHSWSLAPRLL